MDRVSYLDLAEEEEEEEPLHSAFLLFLLLLAENVEAAAAGRILYNDSTGGCSATMSQYSRILSKPSFFYHFSLEKNQFLERWGSPENYQRILKSRKVSVKKARVYDIIQIYVCNNNENCVTLLVN